MRRTAFVTDKLDVEDLTIIMKFITKITPATLADLQHLDSSTAHHLVLMWRFEIILEVLDAYFGFIR